MRIDLLWDECARLSSSRPPGPAGSSSDSERSLESPMGAVARGHAGAPRLPRHLAAAETQTQPRRVRGDSGVDARGRVPGRAETRPRRSQQRGWGGLRSAEYVGGHA